MCSRAPGHVNIYVSSHLGSSAHQAEYTLSTKMTNEKIQHMTMSTLEISRTKSLWILKSLSKQGDVLRVGLQALFLSPTPSIWTGASSQTQESKAPNLSHTLTWMLLLQRNEKASASSGPGGWEYFPVPPRQKLFCNVQ